MKGRRGGLLADVALAVFLLTLALFFILQATPLGWRVHKRTLRIQQADQMAQSMLEERRLEPFDLRPLGTGPWTTRKDTMGYTCQIRWTVEACVNVSNSKLRRHNLTVRWDDVGQTRELSRSVVVSSDNPP